jgi:hypothetical protein
MASQSAAAKRAVPSGEQPQLAIPAPLRSWPGAPAEQLGMPVAGGDESPLRSTAGDTLETKGGDRVGVSAGRAAQITRPC